MGPSGTGKTTLLRLIGGQLRPDSGSVVVDGHEVPKLKRKALYSLREKMGMLFQSGALFTDLSVFENVAFPLRVHTKLPEDMIRDVVLMKLEAVGLRGARQLMPSELSGGMTRRVALARSIALDPELIMYDEPFAGQDPIAMGVLVKLIRDLNSSMGLTSVLVSHDVPESLSICHYACIISDGKVIGRAHRKSSGRILPGRSSSFSRGSRMARCRFTTRPRAPPRTLGCPGVCLDWQNCRIRAARS